MAAFSYAHVELPERQNAEPHDKFLLVWLLRHTIQDRFEFAQGFSFQILHVFPLIINVFSGCNRNRRFSSQFFEQFNLCRHKRFFEPAWPVSFDFFCPGCSKIVIPKPIKTSNINSASNPSVSRNTFTNSMFFSILQHHHHYYKQKPFLIFKTLT